VVVEAAWLPCADPLCLDLVTQARDPGEGSGILGDGQRMGRTVAYDLEDLGHRGGLPWFVTWARCQCVHAIVSPAPITRPPAPPRR
jgi:hypothetical protein